MGQDTNIKIKHGRVEIINYTTPCVIELKIFMHTHPDTPDDLIETVVWLDYEVFDKLKDAVQRFETISTSQIIIE